MFNKKKNILKLEKELATMLSEIEDYQVEEEQELCPHDFTESVSEYITDPAVTDKPIKVWSRTCRKCGKVEYTHITENEYLLVAVPIYEKKR